MLIKLYFDTLIAYQFFFAIFYFQPDLKLKQRSARENNNNNNNNNKARRVRRAANEISEEKVTQRQIEDPLLKGYCLVRIFRQRGLVH